MGIEQALRAAANMGSRAGQRFRNRAAPTRNPFTDLAGRGGELARAWDTAYAAAAYRRGGAGWPADPAGRGHGATTWDALTAAGPDGAGQTAPVTSAALEDEWAITAAGDAGLTGVAVMAYLAAADAQRLALPGGEPAEELHVTLGFLSDPADQYSPEQRAGLEQALAGVWLGPVAASPFAVAHFNRNDPEREPCVVLLVQSGDLANAHDAVAEAVLQAELTERDDFPIWIPHITVGYDLDPATVPDDATGADVTFDRLVVAWGTDQAEITSAASLTAATEDEMTAATDTSTDPAGPAEADPGTAPAEPGWSGPLALLNTPSSDHRILTANGRIRTLPQPLSWQKESDYGHTGSIVVGAVQQVEIRDGQIWGRGTWLGGYNEDVERAKAQVDAGLGLVSVDLAPGAVWFVDAEGNPIDPASYTGDFDQVYMVNDDWEYGGTTIVNFPAFDGVRIVNDPPQEGETMGEPIMIMPGDIGTFAGENAATSQISGDGTSITLPDGTTVTVGDTVAVPAADADGDTDLGSITGIDPEAQTVTVQLVPDADADADDQAEPLTVTVPVTDITPAAAAPADSAAPAAGQGAGRMAVLPPNPATGTAGEDAGIDTLLASSFGQPYNAAFFAQRELLGPTPLTVNRDTGEVYGHLAQWNECHLGKLAEGICTTAPHPKDPTFPYFHLGEVETDAGPIPIGKITVGAGHAVRRGGFMAAAEHYDNSCAQVAVVRAYPDDYGIQVTGQLIHGVPGERVDEMLRAGQLSGDWRKPRGDWELVAALAVNVPGFPVRRPQPEFGFIGDRQVSLVAAGVVEPAEHPTVRLPSGLQIDRNDWEAMVAAVAEAQRRAEPPAAADDALAAAAGLPPVDQLALQRARLRLVSSRRSC